MEEEKEVNPEGTVMAEEIFEGTLVLEKVAEIGQFDEFMDAIDSDDLGKAKKIMKRAGIDAATIAQVLEKIASGDVD